MKKANCQQLLPPNDPAYYLAWADSFNTMQIIDTTKWKRSFEWHQKSNYAFFCDDTLHLDTIAMAAIKNDILDTTNCKISNGTLKLITRKENYNGDCWTWPSCNPITNCNVYNYCDNPSNNTCWRVDTLPFKFTTAMLYSKWDFRYGYYEIRFKLPALPSSPKTLQGHGATFWLWNSSNNVYSEIDGFEINAYNQNTGQYYKGYGNSHFTSTDNTSKPNSDLTPEITFSGNVWHTFGVNWTTNSIDYYYDGNLQYQSKNHPDSLNAMAIIITCGGNYVPVDNYCEPFDTSSTGTFFPFTYEIDYVKVWQLKKDCDTNINLTAFNPGTYPNKLHKTLTLGTNVSVTNQNSQSFWASDYILLNGQTLIDANSNVLLNVTDCDNISFTRVRSSSFSQPMPSSFLYRISLHY